MKIADESVSFRLNLFPIHVFLIVPNSNCPVHSHHYNVETNSFDSYSKMTNIITSKT